MRHDKISVEFCPDPVSVHQDADDWAVYDQDDHGQFFLDGSRTLPGIYSPNNQYIASWVKHEHKTRDGETYPPGIFLIRSQRVVSTIEVAGAVEAAPANDGTIAATADSGNTFYVFETDGTQLLSDEFDSNLSAFAISPDGDYIAVATSHPDNAVHIYHTRDADYLGRTENTEWRSLGHLNFTYIDGKLVVETYEFAPDSSRNIEGRTEVINTIPVQQQLDIIQLDGGGIVPNSSTGLWHHIPEDELGGVNGRLRIPGVEFKTSCNQIFKPLTADTVFSDVDEANKSSLELCEDCRTNTAVLPVKKTERT